MSSRNPPASPSLPWRFSSSLIMGLTGSISRGFLYGLNYMEVTGLDRFLETLDKRKDVESRERGLITGMKPIGVGRPKAVLTARYCDSIKSCLRVNSTVFAMKYRIHADLNRVDDPLIWGVLPFRYAFNPSNHRWSLGSYDICFQNKYALSPVYRIVPPTDLQIIEPFPCSLLSAKSSPPIAAHTLQSTAGSFSRQ